MAFAFGDRVLDVVLDVERRELRRSGGPVAFEPQVFDLLICFVRNRALVVSKDNLIENVWDGPDRFRVDRDDALNAARRALGDSGATQTVIRTRLVC